MYIKAYLTHVDTGIGATDSASYSDQRFKYQEPNFEHITIVHRFNVENGIPYFLCTAPNSYDITELSPLTGVSSITQSEWDTEISNYDNAQEIKRYATVREMRNSALDESDIHVIKQVECNVAITTEFRDWRQELRDLPNGDSFPINWPTPPSNITVSMTQEEYRSTLRNIHMINDPIPAE